VANQARKEARASDAVRSTISTLHFEMQDSSDFRFPRTHPQASTNPQIK